MNGVVPGCCTTQKFEPMSEAVKIWENEGAPSWMLSLDRELPRSGESVRGAAMQWECRSDSPTTSSDGGFVSVKDLESLLLDRMKEFGEARG
jgi:hypothetical protein